ncbi:MAG: ThuA domain-containing protein [Bacteroidota bacterium]
MKKLIPFALIFGVLAWIYPFPDTNVLVLTASSGYQHASTTEGVKAIQMLGERHGYDVVATDEPEMLTEEHLKKYKAVIFLNTAGDLLDYEQEMDLQRFIQAGGGFVGIHGAINTEPDWEWFSEMIGAKYAGHPTTPSNVQPATLYVVDAKHKSTRHLPEVWEREDEWLNFTEVAPDVNVLLAIDELSYNGGTNGVNHPVAWTRTFEGGKIFYTAAGHTAESYTDEAFLQHLSGGIQYVMGLRTPLDYDKVKARRAPDESRFVRTELVAGLNEPTELEILDDGRILFIERRGRVRLLDPEAGEVKEIAKLDVHNEFEDGLMGLALDPGFAQNNWIYLFYSPAGDEAVQHLSRFVFKDDVLEMDSEKLMLVVNTQRVECCHTGGSLEFGPDGNLFISTGDDTNPFASDGFGPIDEQPGRAPWDAQGTSGNTNDLRGKILRIRPEADGSYSIPEGNLFPPDEPLARPEIYVMGNRNPYRIAIDQKTGYLYWGEVGPDANEDNPVRGPRGHDEVNQAREAGFFGWPYFVGDNKAYVDYNFATKESGASFDVNGASNDSPNNTGLGVLPPAQKAFIWYPYAASPEFPIVKSGGRNAMAGPVFYTDMFEPAAGTFPDYFDGKLFIYDWIRGWILVVTMDENGDLEKIEPFMPSAEFANPIDMIFDKNGVMYVMEYGKKWFSENADARISRIEYNPGNRLPVAVLKADQLAGAAPLTVNFSATGSFDHDDDPLSYTWRFAGNPSAIEDATVSHTFNEPGVYKVAVQVTDPAGGKGNDRVRIKVGNAPPQVDLAIEGNRSFFWDSTTLDYHVLVEDAEDGALRDGIAQEDVFVQMDYLKQGFDKTLVAQGHQQADASASLAGGKRLIDNSDCASCHLVNETSIGPSYQDVAERYADDPEAPAYLIEKIRNGGSGVWGETAMAAHPDMTQDEVGAIVEYILAQTKEQVAPVSLPLSGTFSLDAHQEVEQQQGMYFLRASYTDQGANGIGPLTRQSLFVLRHPRVQAETFDFSHNVKVKAGSGSEPTVIEEIYDGSHIGFENIDLTGVAGLKFMLMGTTASTTSGTIEVRMDAVDGQLIGSAPIEMGRLTTGFAFETTLEKQTGQHNIYFIFKDRLDTAYPLFLLDWIEFTR